MSGDRDFVVAVFELCADELAQIGDGQSLAGNRNSVFHIGCEIALKIKGIGGVEELFARFVIDVDGVLIDTGGGVGESP